MKSNIHLHLMRRLRTYGSVTLVHNSSKCGAKLHRKIFNIIILLSLSLFILAPILRIIIIVFVFSV
jgi:hypothetical protein